VRPHADKRPFIQTFYTNSHHNFLLLSHNNLLLNTILTRDRSFKPFTRISTNVLCFYHITNRYQTLSKSQQTIVVPHLCMASWILQLLISLVASQIQPFTKGGRIAELPINVSVFLANYIGINDNINKLLATVWIIYSSKLCNSMSRSADEITKQSFFVNIQRKNIQVFHAQEKSVDFPKAMTQCLYLLCLRSYQWIMLFLLSMMF